MSLGNSLVYKVGLDMSAAEKQLTAFGRFASNVGSEVSSLAASAAKAGAILGAGLAAGAYAIKSIADTGGQMEAFTNRLTILMGSASEAKARMGVLFDFAASTPFELDQVVGAETTLRGFGAAAEDLLPKLIDFSASLGTDLTQSAIDFGKAWSQGGVGLESDTGKILKSMIETSAGMKTADMDIETFRGHMMDVLGDKFAGGADKLSKTFVGMVSNLEDEWTRFKLAVADAGLFDNVKGALSIVLKMINDNRDAIGRFASMVSTGLWSAFKGVVMTTGALIDDAEVYAATLAKATEWAANIGSAFLAWTDPVREAMIAIYEKLYGPDAVAGMKAVDGVLDGVGARLAGIADGARDFGAGIDIGNDRTQQAIGFLDQAEEAARGYAAALGEDGTTKKGAPGSAPGKAGKADTSAQDALLKQFEEAQAFSDSMIEMGRTETQELQAEYALRLEALLNYQEQGLITGQLFQDTLAAIEADRIAKTADLEQEAADEKKRIQASQLQATAGLFGSVANLAGTLGDALADEDKKAAKTAFAVQKAAAIAQGAVNVAMGISDAVASAPPPANIPITIAAAAAGAAALAGIIAAPAPTFHQGGVVYAHQGRAPDEVNARLLRTESVNNSQATRELGAQGINDRNGLRTQPMVVEFSVGRQVTRETFREEARLNGPMARWVRDLAATPNVGFSGAAAVP